MVKIDINSSEVHGKLPMVGYYHNTVELCQKRKGTCVGRCLWGLLETRGGYRMICFQPPAFNLANMMMHSAEA